MNNGKVKTSYSKTSFSKKMLEITKRLQWFFGSLKNEICNFEVLFQIEDPDMKSLSRNQPQNVFSILFDVRCGIKLTNKDLEVMDSPPYRMVHT